MCTNNQVVGWMIYLLSCVSTSGYNSHTANFEDCSNTLATLFWSSSMAIPYTSFWPVQYVMKLLFAEISSWSVCGGFRSLATSGLDIQAKMRFPSLGPMFTFRSALGASIYMIIFSFNHLDKVAQAHLYD